MTRTSMWVATAASISISAFGASASAQAVVNSQTTTQTTALETAPPPASTSGPPVFTDRPRVRFGVDGSLGYAYTGSPVERAHGAAIGLGVRLGAQLNNYFALYYQPNLTAGFMVGRSMSEGVNYGGANVHWTNSLIAEGNLADVVSLGVGPALDYVLAQACASDWSLQPCFSPRGSFPGMHARAAVYFGGKLVNHRAGLSLGIDFHPTFVWDGMGGVGVHLTTLAGIGFESY